MQKVSLNSSHWGVFYPIVEEGRVSMRDRSRATRIRRRLSVPFQMRFIIDAE
jgi:hypothetical protein